MRKRLVGMKALCEKHGIEPADYLLGRMKAYSRGSKPDHAKAIAIAIQLLPYTKRKLAPEQTDAMKEALEKSRLVILGLPSETE